MERRCPLSRSPRIADLGAGPARFEDFGERGSRHGPRQVEALRRLAAARTQEFELSARFHAFGRHAFSECVRHGDDGFDQCTGRIVLWDFIQEAAIQFYGMHRIPAQIVERGIAGAEIVERQLDAEGGNGAQRLFDFAVGQHRFHQLELQAARG